MPYSIPSSMALSTLEATRLGLATSRDTRPLCTAVSHAPKYSSMKWISGASMLLVSSADRSACTTESRAWAKGSDRLVCGSTDSAADDDDVDDVDDDDDDDDVSESDDVVLRATWVFPRACSGARAGPTARPPPKKEAPAGRACGAKAADSCVKAAAATSSEMDFVRKSMAD
eukprot:scaffold51859_cov52-Attheya_sp.AAC.1